MHKQRLEIATSVCYWETIEEKRKNAVKQREIVLNRQENRNYNNSDIKSKFARLEVVKINNGA